MQFEALDVSRAFLAANVPFKWESLPGAGKTSLLNAITKVSNGYLHTMVGVTHDPTDFGGVPVPKDDRYLLLPGGWAVDIAEACQNHALVVLFLDEANTAGRAVLAAELKLVDERRVGNYALPAEVRIVLAVNPSEANGGVDLPPAMANRMGHIPFVFPEQDWLEGLKAGFPDPEPLVIPDEASVKAAALGKAALVSRFLSGQPNYIEQYPDELSQRSGPFPSRRTWTLGTRVMGASELLSQPESLQYEALGALVGKRAADAFSDWAEAEAKVNIADYLADPENAQLPTRDDLLFVTLTKLTTQALADADKGDDAALQAACRVMVRVSTELGRPGVAAASIREVAQFLNGHRELMSGPVRDALREFRPVIAQLEGE